MLIEIIVFILAKGTTKGIPNRNIKKFNGVPLICRTIWYAFSAFTKNYKSLMINLEKNKNTISRCDNNYDLLKSVNSSTTKSSIIRTINNKEIKPEF